MATERNFRGTRQFYIDELFTGLDRYTPFRNGVVAWFNFNPRYFGLSSRDYKATDIIYPDESVETNSSDKPQPHVYEFLSAFESQPVYLVSYCSTEYLEDAVSGFPNVRILNNPARLKDRLDKKSYVRRELQKCGMRLIEGHEARVNENCYKESAGRYGLPFFVQFDDVAGGSGSYLVSDRDDFHKVLESHRGETAVFMRFVEGRSLNMNAVRTDGHTVLSEPSFQIIGDPRCTTRRFGYCGNDFNVGSKLSDEEIQAMRDIASKAGEWLGEQGYRGAFGVDFISCGDGVYFNEINPRFQGSTSLLTRRQIDRGKVPLTFFHFLPYFGLDASPESARDYNKFNPGLSASQILLYNMLGGDAVVRASPLPGRYKFDGRTLTRVGKEVSLSDIKSDEIILASDIPFDGTTLLRDADEIGRIYTREEVLDRNGMQLNRYGRNLVEAVRREIKLE
jgi:hypothetical protein